MIGLPSGYLMAELPGPGPVSLDIRVQGLMAAISEEVIREFGETLDLPVYYLELVHDVMRVFLIGWPNRAFHNGGSNNV